MFLGFEEKKKSLALTNAIYQKNWENVKLLITKYEVNVNKPIQKGEATPLMHASYAGDLKIVRLLCDAKANVSYATTKGQNSVMCAVQQGHLEVVRYLLLKCKSCINAHDAHGFTPLLYSIGHNKTPIMKMLVDDFNASLKKTQLVDDVNGFLKKTQQKITPLMFAIEFYQDQMPHIRYLVSKSREIITHIHLQIAAVHHHHDVITFLVENGIDYKQISTFLNSSDSKQAIQIHKAIQRGLFLVEFHNIQNLLSEEMRKIPLELITIISSYSVTHVSELYDWKKRKYRRQKIINFGKAWISKISKILLSY